MSLLSNFLTNKADSPSSGEGAAAQSLKIGEVLSNRYLLLELLGQGAMGQVYHAEDKLLGVSVAIKVIAQHLINPAMLASFSREAQIGAFLGHQNVNIVRITDFGIHNEKVPFYVMEYLYGVTLEHEIRQGPLSLLRFLHLMEQICGGLMTAHQGVILDKNLYCVIHRDVKPGNLFITDNSSLGELIKILDFGIAGIVHHTRGCKKNKASGTLAYSSAEQLKGCSLEVTADIYSLGITMFESLTGHLPIVPRKNTVVAWIQAHTEQPPQHLQAVAPRLDLPLELDLIIQKCLAKNPADRPQTVQEVQEQLRQITHKVKSVPFSLPPMSAGQSRDQILHELFAKEESSAASSHPSAALNHNFKPPLRSTPPKQTQESAVPQSSETAASNSYTESRLEMLLQRSLWPEDKPVGEIVFPKLIKTESLSQTTLWVMLSHAQIQHSSLPHWHIEFVFEFGPYPMMAWITVLYNDIGHTRWLPCYLNLFEPERVKMLHTLVHTGNYLFLLFDMHAVGHPIHVACKTIDKHQQQKLAQALKAIGLPSNEQKAGCPDRRMINLTRQKIRERYQQLKEELPQKLGFPSKS